jgi:hypothetical protein
MGTSTFVEDFNATFEYAPVQGRSNDYVIQSKNSHPNGGDKKEMTSTDWDKFEKDIDDAFEQVP